MLTGCFNVRYSTYLWSKNDIVIRCFIAIARHEATVLGILPCPLMSPHLSSEHSHYYLDCWSNQKLNLTQNLLNKYWPSNRGLFINDMIIFGAPDSRAPGWGSTVRGLKIRGPICQEPYVVLLTTFEGPLQTRTASPATWSVTILSFGITQDISIDGLIIED